MIYLTKCRGNDAYKNVKKNSDSETNPVLHTTMKDGYVVPRN